MATQTVESYLGIKVDNYPNRSFGISQLHLINRIIDFVSGMKDCNPEKTPTTSSIVLTKDINVDKRNESWNYGSVIGMMNYLVNLTHPELAY